MSRPTNKNKIKSENCQLRSVYRADHGGASSVALIVPALVQVRPEYVLLKTAPHILFAPNAWSKCPDDPSHLNIFASSAYAELNSVDDCE